MVADDEAPLRLSNAGLVSGNMVAALIETFNTSYASNGAVTAFELEE